jgi:hypothetical protein
MKRTLRRRQLRTRRLRRGGDENVAPNLETGSNVSADVFQDARKTLRKPMALGIKTPSQTTHEFQKVQLKSTPPTSPRAGRRTRRHRKRS